MLFSRQSKTCSDPKETSSARQLLIFKRGTDFSLCSSTDGSSQTEVCATAATKQTRHKFGATLHADFDEDVAQMKLYGLITYLQSRSDFGIRESLRTAERYLCFATA